MYVVEVVSLVCHEGNETQGIITRFYNLIFSNQALSQNKFHAMLISVFKSGFCKILHAWHT